jgi:hypothetical protein
MKSTPATAVEDVIEVEKSTEAGKCAPAAAAVHVDSTASN